MHMLNYIITTHTDGFNGCKEVVLKEFLTNCWPRWSDFSRSDPTKRLLPRDLLTLGLQPSRRSFKRFIFLHKLLATNATFFLPKQRKETRLNKRQKELTDDFLSSPAELCCQWCPYCLNSNWIYIVHDHRPPSHMGVGGH